MKKTMKFLFAALLVSLMFSCIVVEYDREITFYNETGREIDYLYVIPADEYPTYGYYDYDYAFNTYFNYEADQIPTSTLRTGYYVTINLDNVDRFEDQFIVVAFDGRDMYKKTFYGSNTSLTLRYDDKVYF